MNFNFSAQPEYDLHTSLAEEMIRLYGVLTKFLLVEKINSDEIVFGDYTHLKSNSTDIYDIYALPENTEDWDQGDYEFGGHGLLSTGTTRLFVAKRSLDGVVEVGGITGNLVVFPNNKVMEITSTEPMVPGVNNLFTYSDQKSVYQISCKPYSFKTTGELDPADLSVDGAPYETLDRYFDELAEHSDDQDTEAEVTPQVETVDTTSSVDTKVEKPIVDNSEKSVWGDFD